MNQRTDMWNLLRDMRKARRGGPAAIARRQRDRLAAMVNHARADSPFYRELYRGLPDTVTDPTLLPVTDKATLMADFDNWITAPDLTLAEVRDFVADPSRIGQRLHRRYPITTTSGTTGVHGIFVQDPHSAAVTAAMAGRMVGSLVGVRDALAILAKGRRIAFVVPDGGHFASAAAAARFASHRAVKVFSVHKPLQQLVEELNRWRPALLLPYATVGALLGREAEAGRLTIDPVLVMLSAEGLPPTEYDRIAAAFDATVGHSWAANEVPFLSYGCRYHWLHVNADWVIVEPVGADHQPVPPGEPSHTVLVTNLANRIQPILRYDLGDSVVMRPDRCECGNPLPAVRVQGRAADLLTLTTGAGEPVALAPLAVVTLVERVRGVELFQVVQTSPTGLSVRLRPAEGVDMNRLWTEVHGDLAALLAEHGLSGVTVERAIDPPQQTTGGKYRTVIPLREAGT